MERTPYTKTLRDVLKEIKNHFSNDEDVRITYFKIDAKWESSTSSLSYNEKEVNKRLDREGINAIKV